MPEDSSVWRSFPSYTTRGSSFETNTPNKQVVFPLHVTLPAGNHIDFDLKEEEVRVCGRAEVTGFGPPSMERC